MPRSNLCAMWPHVLKGLYACIHCQCLDVQLVKPGMNNAFMNS